MRGVALVGSFARGTARPDSDVDIVILTDEPSRYVSEDGWAIELGTSGIIATRSWGAVTERRAVVLPGGLEVEFGITTPEWASIEPLDAGTQRVVRDGIRIVHDPDGLLDRLIRAAR